jgi:hypothetical protein
MSPREPQASQRYSTPQCEQETTRQVRLPQPGHLYSLPTLGRDRRRLGGRPAVVRAEPGVNIEVGVRLVLTTT